MDPALAVRLAPHAGEIVQIAREALSNVRRHARAATCRISLRQADGHALLEIDDDGCGFDVSTVGGAGQGLHNLAERSRGLDGQLEIRSDSTGTAVRVRLPLPVPLPLAAAGEIRGGLGPVGHFQFHDDAGHVVAHRLLRQAQLGAST